LQKKLGDHGGDAVEMVGPGGAAEVLGEVADAHLGAEMRRIHLARLGRIKKLAAGGGKRGRVAGLVAGIGVKVLPRAELQRVDEQGGDDAIGLRLSEGNQG
jgi:hypothetical protein